MLKFETTPRVIPSEHQVQQPASLLIVDSGSNMPTQRKSTQRILPSVDASGILGGTTSFSRTKGPPHTEFVEWVGDLSYGPVGTGNYIRGFGRVHGGFMERFSRDAFSQGKAALL